MDNHEQRKRLEIRAGLALVGGAYDWKDTEISETATAIATDPVRLARGDWWTAAEPPPLSWLDNLKRFASRAKDDKVAEQKSIAPHAKDRKGKRRAATDEGEDFEQYLPKPDDDAQEWLNQLSTKIQMTPERMPWRDALMHYIQKFTKGKKGTKASALDPNVVRSIVKMMCEEDAA
jgi:hypothetical protein